MILNMPEKSRNTPQSKSAWWIVWLIGTVVGPTVCGACVFQDRMNNQVFFWPVVALSLGLVILASVKISKGTYDSSSSGCGLIIGGLALAFAAFFTGCALTVHGFK